MPEGTVTFLFSDVEGSTQLLERHGAAMGEALARHHGLFEDIVGRHEGVIFETVGDAVYAAFARPADAVAAALDVQRALAAEDWGSVGRLAVRIALHTGAVERRGSHYFGSALFRAARLQVLGYGEQTLLSGVTAGLVADALPANASLRSHGTHRLKDLGEPEEVLELVHPDLRSDFPALKSLDAHPHNLPVQLSSFVGREADLAAIAKLLTEQRLVTLLGPGGIGKTRLALQAAAEQIEHFTGVHLVDLAPLRDPELVPGAIATTLGLREQEGQPMSSTLALHLRDRSPLLVLDNLEQLLPAVGPTVTELLATAPGLRVLATSRAPLRVRGEREYQVPPLDAGRQDQLEREPPAAVALFVERAREIGVELDVSATGGPMIATICRRLDGLPLAIELAAARLRLFGLEALNDRLARRLPFLTGGARDMPERQQTLRAAIAWSEGLLTDPERSLLGQLGVFVGSFGLAFAAAIAGRPEADVTEAIEALVEHSLLQSAPPGPDAEPRFAMLETIREYAVERLEASGEADETRRRKIAYCVSAIEGAASFLLSPDLASGIRRGGTEAVMTQLRLDYPNLRGALQDAIARGEQDEALRMIAGLALLWIEEGPLRDAAELGDAALAIGDPPVSMSASSALNRLGVIHSMRGDVAGARRLYGRALEMRRVIGDLSAIESTLLNLGTVAETPDEAITYLNESLEIQRQLGYELHGTLGNLVMVRLELDELERGRLDLEQALEMARRAGDHSWAGLGLYVLGRLARHDGDGMAARALFEAAVDEARAASEPCLEAGVMAGLARCDLDDGLAGRAEERLVAAFALVPRAEDWDVGAHWLHELMEAAGHLRLVRGDPLGAAEVWGALAVARKSNPHLQLPFRQRELNTLVADAIAATDEPAFWESWQRGRRATSEQLVALTQKLILRHAGDSSVRR